MRNIGLMFPCLSEEGSMFVSAIVFKAGITSEETTTMRRLGGGNFTMRRVEMNDRALLGVNGVCCHVFPVAGATCGMPVRKIGLMPTC